MVLLRVQCDLAIGLLLLALLMREETPDASECQTQFRIRPRPDLGGDDIGRPSAALAAWDTRKMLGLGTAAEQDTKTHPVGHRV